MKIKLLIYSLLMFSATVDAQADNTNNTGNVIQNIESSRDGLLKIMSSGFGKTKEDAIRIALQKGVEQSCIKLIDISKDTFDSTKKIKDVSFAVSNTIIDYAIIYEASNADNYFVVVSSSISPDDIVNKAKTKGYSFDFTGNEYTKGIKTEKFYKSQEVAIIDDFFRWWYPIDLFESKIEIDKPRRSEGLGYASTELRYLGNDLFEEPFRSPHFFALEQYLGDGDRFAFRYTPILPNYVIKQNDSAVIRFNEVSSVFKNEEYDIKTSFSYYPTERYFQFLQSLNILLKSLSVTDSYDEALYGKLSKIAFISSDSLKSLIDGVTIGKAKMFYISDEEPGINVYKLRNNIASRLKYYSIQMSRQQLTPFSHRLVSPPAFGNPILLDIGNFCSILDIKETLGFDTEYIFLGKYWQYDEVNELIKVRVMNAPIKSALNFKLSLQELDKLDAIKFEQAPRKPFVSYYSEWQATSMPPDSLRMLKERIAVASKVEAISDFNKLYNYLELPDYLNNILEGAFSEESDVAISFVGYDKSQDLLFFSIMPSSGVDYNSFLYDFKDGSCKRLFRGLINSIDVKKKTLLSEAHGYDDKGRYWQIVERDFKGTALKTQPKQR